MRYLAIASLLLVSTFAARTVRADDNDPYTRKGGYLGIGATYGVEEMEGTFKDAFPTKDADVSNTWGAHATAGYRFGKFISTEVEYEWMKGFNVRDGGVAMSRVQTQVATLNLKVHAPFGQWQPYFLVGAGAIWPTQTNQQPLEKQFLSHLGMTNPSFAARFGAGLDYYLTPSFYLNVGTDVVFNTVQVSGVGGSNGRGLNYLATQAGFGFRF
jgi:outer membrane protein W